MHDRNDLAYWFPLLRATGVPVPRSEVVSTEVRLVQLLDGERPEGLDGFLNELADAAEGIGYPCFLRTGHTSAKHYWRDTCHVERVEDLLAHVVALVEFSEMVDLLGLPTSTWAVREFLPLRHSFTAFAGMPVAREFRAFIADGAVRCIHPYWPPDAIDRPSRPDWRELLDAAQRLHPVTENALRELAGRVARQFAGGWSVDFAQHVDGHWVAIDMASAERSFHWPECPHGRGERRPGTATSGTSTADTLWP